MRKINNPILREIAEYVMITLSILLMCVGIYFFKFPNNFSFGGVSGLAPAISRLTGMDAPTFTSAANIVLLVLGFFFLGKSVGIRTVYSTVVMTLVLNWMDKGIPMKAPLTNEPLLDLMFAIILPGAASAILFDIDASSGGTDIIAMILRKYTRMNIAMALFVVDIAAVVLSFIMFGPQTGLLSILGLVVKSLIINAVIENLHMNKCFNIICDHPKPICDFIINELHHSATVYRAEGAYTHQEKAVVMTMMSRSEAIRLRDFIRQQEPHSFIQITNSSEIIGKGFDNV
ncbi:MAG: YitT family protein [Clostridia bacterium]|nr:YitT family protein [Clostridia bacterium]